MHRFMIVIGFLFLAGQGQGCAMNGGMSDEAKINAVKALDAGFTSAFSKGDVDGMMARYWDSLDLVVFPPDAMQARGSAGVREGLNNVLKSMPGAKLELTEPHYTVAGDAVIGWGLWKISFPESHGTQPDLLGRYTEVAMQKDGKWVLVVDHASVPSAGH